MRLLELPMVSSIISAWAGTVVSVERVKRKSVEWRFINSASQQS
ncbi:hypothetical protein ACLB1Q_18650 [Escherichia coli]